MIRLRVNNCVLEAEHSRDSGKDSVELARPKVSNSSLQKCKQVEVKQIMGGKAEAEDGGRRSLFGGRGADTVAAAAAADRAAALRPVEYPLYCDSNRERPRFAGGCRGWLAGGLAV